jgi:hypothetical protein
MFLERHDDGCSVLIAAVAPSYAIALRFSSFPLIGLPAAPTFYELQRSAAETAAIPADDRLELA